MKTAFLVPPFSPFLLRFTNEADFHEGDRSRELACLVVERGRPNPSPRKFEENGHENGTCVYMCVCVCNLSFPA